MSDLGEMGTAWFDTSGVLQEDLDPVWDGIGTLESSPDGRKRRQPCF